MARSFSEIGKKAEALIEQGREADQNLSACQARVTAAGERVAAARNRLAAAQQTDEAGRPAGDVTQARALLAVAEQQLAASERALARADEAVTQVRAEKQAQAEEIRRYRDAEQANLKKLGTLAAGPFGADQRTAGRAIAGRLNEAENIRIALLKSMGIRASAEYAVALEEGTAEDPWAGGRFFGGLAKPDEAGLSGEERAVMPGAAGLSGEPGAVGSGAYGTVGSGAFPLDPAAPDEDPPKVLKLSPHERKEMGLRYIDNILEVYRDNLRDLGVADGEAMEFVMSELRMGLTERLEGEIRDGTYGFYDYPEPDYKELAERAVRLGAALSSGKKAPQQTDLPPEQMEMGQLLLTEEQRREQKRFLAERARREQVREGIRNGTVTEHEIRQAGAAVRERCDALIGRRNADWDRIHEAQRSLAAEFREAKTPEEQERIEVRRQLLMLQENLYHENYDRRNIMRAVLAERRRLGPTDPSIVQRYHNENSLGASGPIKAINSVREYLPTEWIEKSSEKPIVARHRRRGYFKGGAKRDKIAISGEGADAQRCAFHEMGHRFESLIPEILTLEKQFYERRTAGEKKRWLGFGYGLFERTRVDQFVSAYMGKDYGGKGYELFSMGLESLYCGSYNLARDTEYQDFIFGILSEL